MNQERQDEYEEGIALLHAEIARLQSLVIMGAWLPIGSAPRDGTQILGWCDHGADPYLESDTRLTLYGAHAEGMSHVCDGPHVIVWGGAFDDRTWEDQTAAHVPDWWFLHGSDFEVTANPTHWMQIPPPDPTR